MSAPLDRSKCYATTTGAYLGRYNNTRSVIEGGGGAPATVHNFEKGDCYDSKFIVVDCKSVGSVGKDYVEDEAGIRSCQFCGAVEDGTKRIITHYYNCENKKGGRKNRKPTKKNRRRTRRSSRKNHRRIRRSNNN